MFRELMSFALNTAKSTRQTVARACSFKDLEKEDVGQVSITQLPQIVIVLGISGLIIGLMMLILAAFKVANTTDSAVNDTIDQVINGFTQMGNFFGILGITAIAAIIIGFVLVAFAVGFQAQGRRGGGF